MSSSVGKSPVVASSSRVVQTMLEKEFSDVVSCLMRIVWAAAAGNLQLAASSLQNPVASDHQSSSARQLSFFEIHIIVADAALDQSRINQYNIFFWVYVRYTLNFFNMHTVYKFYS
jgi:hypothetical protein